MKILLTNLELLPHHLGLNLTETLNVDQMTVLAVSVDSTWPHLLPLINALWLILKNPLDTQVFKALLAPFLRQSKRE